MTTLVVLGLFVGWLTVAMLLRNQFPYWGRVFLQFDILVASLFGAPEGVTLSGWLGILLTSDAWMKRAFALAICRPLDLIERLFGGDGRHCEGAIVQDAGDPLPVAMVIAGFCAVVVSIWAVVLLT